MTALVTILQIGILAIVSSLMDCSNSLNNFVTQTPLTNANIDDIFNFTHNPLESWESSEFKQFLNNFSERMNALFGPEPIELGEAADQVLPNPEL